MNNKTRRLPRKPITPPNPIEGQFIVSNVTWEDSYGFKSMRLELMSHGEITFNRFPTNSVTLVEVKP